MARASRLATATSAANSTNVTILDKPKAVGLRVNGNSGVIPRGVVCAVMRVTGEDDSPVYVRDYNGSMRKVELTAENPVEVLVAPGTYYVARPLLTTLLGAANAVGVGVYEEDTA